MVDTPFGSTYRTIQVIWIMWNKSTCLLRVALTLIVWTGSPVQTCQAEPIHIECCRRFCWCCQSFSLSSNLPSPAQRNIQYSVNRRYSKIINVNAVYTLSAQRIAISHRTSCRKVWYMNFSISIKQKKSLASDFLTAFVVIYWCDC